MRFAFSNRASLTALFCARFLASTIGGDVCYGTGTYTVSTQTFQCALKSDIPGPPPVCPAAYEQCGGKVGPNPFLLPPFCKKCPDGFVCEYKNDYYSQCTKSNASWAHPAATW